MNRRPEHRRASTSGVTGWVLLASVLLVSACDAAPAGRTETADANPHRDGTSAVVDHPAARAEQDVATPLIVSHLARTVPVRGTDGRYHLSYELQVLNASSRDALVTRIDTVSVASGAVTATTPRDVLLERGQLVGRPPDDGTTGSAIPAGRTAVFSIDDVYDDIADVPTPFVNTVSAVFTTPPDPGVSPEQNADAVEVATPPQHLAAGAAAMLGAPVRGENWLIVKGCCEMGHRSYIGALNGRLNAAERMAIDLVKLDPEQLADPTKIPPGLIPTVVGDPTENSSYLAYREPLIAVSDATVVEVLNGDDDKVPQAFPVGLPMMWEGGNAVILDIGDSTYVRYAHMLLDSITVEVGDRVVQGDVLGLIGNSGHSTEAHLHFQVARGTAHGAADAWPFQFEEFVLQGTLDENLVLDTTTRSPGPRTDELPLNSDVIDFP